MNIPLSFEAHAIAQRCYAGVANPQKAKQIYLNSLAVYAVDYYLRLMGIETDWGNSHSQNPQMVQLLDVADLEIKHLGKLECRPVLPEAEVMQIPAEVWGDRLGYIAVNLTPALKEATLLGFTQIPNPEVALKKLDSLETLLIHLSELETAVLSAATIPESIKLRQWLDGVVDAGWQRVETLLRSPQLDLAFRFRTEVKMTWGQKIDLGQPLADGPVALVVTLPPVTTEGMDILMQVHPIGQVHLAEGVQLIISDEAGTQIAATSRTTDNFIQLRFTAQAGETFQVTVAYRDERVAQLFSV